MYINLCHLDDLSAAEAEFLVVVKHSVHALNPQSVHRPIEHEPLLVWRVIGHSLTDEAGYDTIRPIENETYTVLVRCTYIWSCASQDEYVTGRSYISQDP